MEILISIVFASIGSIVAVIFLYNILKRINPQNISDYRKCKGDFRESYLNNCEAGLLKIPQQPINTYTNIVYLTGGLFLMFEFSNLTTYVFFLTTLYLFISSSWFHATSSNWGTSRCKCNVCYLYGNGCICCFSFNHIKWFNCSVTYVCCGSHFRIFFNSTFL